VDEIAILYGCLKHTVRNWLASGLQPIDDRRPTMVRGDVLNEFHASRRAKAKKPCGPGHMYCLPCQGPQRPGGDIADYAPLSATSGMLSAICPGCGRMLFQRVNQKRLAEFRALIEVSVRER
jgi:hypothetical protein